MTNSEEVADMGFLILIFSPFTKNMKETDTYIWAKIILFIAF